ncbi:unnamed protein product, partial [Thlaspi arvense]
RFFTPQGVEAELRHATREFFRREDGITVDLPKRTVYLNSIKAFMEEFDMRSKVQCGFWNREGTCQVYPKFPDATKTGLLTHLWEMVAQLILFTRAMIGLSTLKTQFMYSLSFAILSDIEASSKYI